MRQLKNHLETTMSKQTKRVLIQIAALVVLGVILVPQFKQFSASWDSIKNGHIEWAMIGLVAVLATTIFASLVYKALVPKKLPLMRTIVIQIATYFTNRLLPSGIGGLGFNTLYITRQTGLSRTEAAAYATINNILGFVAFWLSALVAALISRSRVNLPGISMKAVLIVVVIGAGVVLASFLSAGIKKNILGFGGHMWGVLLAMSKSPGRVALALTASMGITFSYVSILYCASRVVGVDVTVSQLFIAFVAGNAALSVSPTPGGLGAVEAAMTALLVSLGTGSSDALATVLVYRGLSYWLPIVPGFIAFKVATARKYV